LSMRTVSNSSRRRGSAETRRPRRTLHPQHRLVAEAVGAARRGRRNRARATTRPQLAVELQATRALLDRAATAPCSRSDRTAALTPTSNSAEQEGPDGEAQDLQHSRRPPVMGRAPWSGARHEPPQ
jgi:hypothetical protein